MLTLSSTSPSVCDYTVPGTVKMLVQNCTNAPLMRVLGRYVIVKIHQHYFFNIVVVVGILHFLHHQPTKREREKERERDFLDQPPPKKGGFHLHR